MSSMESITFGEFIRQLREDRNLPLRKIAAELDIDTSTLSKIEKNERSANDKLIEKLAIIFSIKIEDLKLYYLSDKISSQLLYEENVVEILKVAEQKIIYNKRQKQL
jgi:HTH-type transcriptional regulator, competence development regulator